MKVMLYLQRKEQIMQTKTKPKQLPCKI